MQKNRLLWRIYLYFLIATLAALAVATGYAVRSLRRFHEEQVASDLGIRAQLVARDVLRYALDRDSNDIDRLCKNLGQLTGTRITVILPGGVVIGDSDEDPARMDNHAQRPEIAEALLGKTGESARFSDTFKRTLKYVAVPVQRAGEIVAVVRVSQPLAEIQWTRRIISRQIFLGGISAAVLFAVVALYLSRRITRPLEEMRRVAGRLAQGDLNSRMVVSTDDEVGALAQTLNQMAAQLSDRMGTIARQQVEQHAVLTCMVEGVLAVDPDGCIMYLNDAAARLLDVAMQQACGRSVQEVVRHHELQEFIIATLTNPDTSEAEIVMRGINERHVQLHGTTLMDPAGQHIGGLVVVNDITRLKRLETVRSDFVANVSHELKTPMTALKGCVETLTADIPPEPADAARFFDMMSRHVCRLEAIVEDLMSLSRIEFEVGRGEMQCESISICNVLERVVQTFAVPAKAKCISLTVNCPVNIEALVNGALLEQAVGNLVDNAIKYSGEETCVSITAEQDGAQLIIKVTDQGPGIEQQHLPRIFERFYRVDRARSRGLGGTGLGLSIVKHIVLAHQGHVAVESITGKGSIFVLHLPQL